MSLPLRAPRLTGSTLPAPAKAMPHVLEPVKPSNDLAVQKGVKRCLSTFTTYRTGIVQFNTIVSAQTDSRMGFVSVEDVAQAAPNALTAEKLVDSDIFVTGLELFSNDEYPSWAENHSEYLKLNAQLCTLDLAYQKSIQLSWRVWKPRQLQEQKKEPSEETQNVAVHDCLSKVPDYDEDWTSPREFILSTVKSSRSPSETYKFIRDLKEFIVSRSNDSHLTLHIQGPSPLLPFLIQTSFSSSLNHLIVHPPALFHYLATEYLSPPPPASPEVKFWGIFIPVSERISDVTRIVYGTGGEGSGGSEEFIVEVVSRGGENGGRRKAVERVLEGWDIKQSLAVELAEMSSLKALFGQPTATVEEAPNPAQNLSFNLNLTTSQQEARAQVPLPYAHEGKTTEQQIPAAILYDPDSGDDIDDDDPDEDLDI
ncbi:hypothetical protein CPB85DRAFT_1450478 [Mucidula mucida]|nr:hypothetical protein CPB85DRAFT_1450478 [Mucidula mucida]